MKAWNYRVGALGIALVALSLPFSLCAEDVRLVNLPSMPESKVVHKVRPMYPPDAVERKVQGVVKFRVTIDNDGKVIGVRLISGDPLLRPAAMQAVRQWVYEPTLVNGNPVRVVTEVAIPFTLDREGRALTPSENEARVVDRPK